MANKNQIKILKLQIETLEMELKDPYTINLGQAAVKCVQETLDAKKAELQRVSQKAYRS